jgi:hypothetical protein
MSRRDLGYVSGFTTVQAFTEVPYGTATGGTSSSITVGGINYTLLTFTSSGTLTVTKSGLFDVICVGGGGGGGYYPSTDSGGGGGGAGGVTPNTTVYLDANQTITVGGKGLSTAFGTSSTLGSLIGAQGGGGGAPGTNVTAGSGGSGAGAIYTAAIGRGTILQGNNGGTAVAATPGSGGGGGGKGAVGGNGSGGTGGAGGAGFDISVFIGGSSTFIAGGGGAKGTVTGGTAGSSTGGNGVSGNSGIGSNATATAYGSGGGGGHTAGGTGADGIVYVRFRV